jgi:hypothetical protein
MKLIITLITLLLTFIKADMVDAIAIDVNGKPITTLEIERMEKKLNISKKMAVELLIQDRLEKKAIEDAKIEVSDEEVDAKIREIASKKGLSLDMLRSALQKEGINFNKYKEEIKNAIKKEKFFIKEIIPSIKKPTEEDLKLFYQTHKNEFTNTAPMSQISVISYFSKSSKKLKEAISNPMMVVNGVIRKNQLIGLNDVPQKVYQLIANTPEGSFTKPINTGRGFVAYYIKSKSMQSMDSSFDMVKNQVESRWLQEERKKAMKDFVNKLRNSAEIRIIRL